MGLNPHLINLMSVRERQGLEALKTSTPSHAVGQQSFTETFKDAFAVASMRQADGQNLSSNIQLARNETIRENLDASSAETPRRTSPAQVMNPERLLKEFLTEQEQAGTLSAQRMPNGRYRTNPDDDTNGEAGTRANLRPIE